MKRRVLACLFLTSFSLRLYAQQDPVQPSANKRVAKILETSGAKTDVPSVPMKGVYLPVRCDSEGTIYFRGYSDKHSPEVTSISADGSKVQVFDFSADTKLGNVSMSDFTLKGQKTLTIPVSAAGGSKIVELSDEGKVDKVTPVEGDVFIAHAASFGGKGWLLLGTKQTSTDSSEGSSSTKSRIAFRSIYSDSGSQLRAVNLNEKAADSQTAETKDSAGSKGSNYTEASGAPISNEDAATYFADVESGSNGNVFLLEPGATPRIMEVNFSGEVVRTLNISPPAEGMRPSQMFIAAHDIAIDFIESHQDANDDESIEIIDANTGDQKEIYTVPITIPGTLACYNGHQFTFLMNTKGHAGLQHAAP